MIKLNNRGDTIIEVLISLAVLGLVIGSAYGIANRSLKGMRMAQERSEALKIAEGQIELIKSGNTTITNGCIGGNCYDVNNLYDINVNNTTGPGIYIVQVTWKKIGGGNENLELRYGVY